MNDATDHAAAEAVDNASGDARPAESADAPPKRPMSPQADKLAGLITVQLSKVIEAAIEAKAPIEIDPSRGQIFELFVTADAAGLIDEAGQTQPLSSGELTRRLGRLWNLGDAIEEVDGDQSKLTPSDLERLRRLWSLLRMWLEWSYAWNRWDEFHQGGRTVLPEPAAPPAESSSPPSGD